MDNGIKVTTKIEQEAEAEATTMKQQSKSEEQQQWIMESEQLARRTKSSGDRRGASTIVQPCEFAGVKVTPLQRRRRNMARWQLTTAIRDEDDSMAWYFLAEIEGPEQKSYSEAEKGLQMLLDFDPPALEEDFLELQKPNWRDLNCVGK
ncbi:uncharacterized protein [Arachis hypogaea]|uniref:uncharacterized protein n=1 Tax=Arachis hypogaea TaxID=3818 RepID=UPI003B2161BB